MPEILRSPERPAVPSMTPGAPRIDPTREAHARPARSPDPTEGDAPDPEYAYTVIRSAPLADTSGRATIREATPVPAARPAARGSPPAGTPAAARPPARPPEAPRLRRGLTMGEVIAVGTTSTVRAARQLDLDRDVAVKSVNEPRWEPDLVHEARVLGTLEHPNIVPVYGLARSPTGELMLMMKRVDGHRWADVLASIELTTSLCGGRDPLLFQLEVLLAVTDAVAFAHSRGIVHRDLKPENVLVGRFGQIFVMDWKQAVSTVPGRGIPLASEVMDVTGTPAFMAPEQALAFGTLIGPRTDVYLLGAILYHLLTGALPHPGRDVRTRLEHAARAQPLDPEDVPEGLARVVRRATAEDPSARHASAAELRTDLQRWLDQRGAERLVVEALRLRGDLEREVLAVERKGGREPNQARQLLTEARFAFRQAQLAGRSHGSAARGHDESLALGIRLALAERDATEARRLLEEISAPPVELVRAVDAIEGRLGWELATLDAMRRQAVVPPEVGRRGLLGAAAGAAIGGLCAAFGLLDALVRPAHAYEVLLALVVFDVGVFLALVVPGAWTASIAVRRLRLLLAALMVAGTLHWLSAAATDASVRSTVTGDALLAATVLGVGAATVDPWLVLAALPYLAAWLVGLAFPNLALLVFGTATAASITLWALVSGAAETLASGRAPSADPSVPLPRIPVPDDRFPLPPSVRSTGPSTPPRR